MGFLSLFFAMSMFVNAERFSVLAVRISGVKALFASPLFFQYVSLVLGILAIMVIASSIIRSRIYFERKTIFGKAVVAKAKGYSKRIDDRAKEALTLIVILTLAYIMTGPTLKPLLGEPLWTSLTMVFFMIVSFTTLLSLIVLLTRASIAYLAAMYEVHMEMSRGPLEVIPEIEEV
jgi:hypothetical protein